MQVAVFKSEIGNPIIDERNGIISGVRIATLGAVSESKEGRGRGLVIDNATITALFELAKNKGDKVPAFFTHDWFDSDDDGLKHDAGVWRNFRVDGAGNLIADFNAFDTDRKAGIFSRAKTDPDGIATSPLFHYDFREGDKNRCTPTEFVSCDFVKRGAINKALFSQTNPQNNMTIEEFIQLLSNPEVKTAIEAIVKSHADGSDAAPAGDAAPDDAALAEYEADAGVEDGDKKKEDDNMPAVMRAHVRVARAIARKTAALKADKDAILAEAKIQAEASQTAILGRGPILNVAGAAKEDANNPEAFIAEQIASGKAKTRGHAIAIMGKQKPELYAIHTSRS